MNPALRRRLAAALVLLAVAGAAFGHGAVDRLDAGVPWTFDPWITVPLLVAALAYGIGLARVWGRSSSHPSRRLIDAALYAAGWLVLAASLVSPLHALGEQLFFAHMIEHELMMAVAAPLMVLARPGGIMLWSLPATWRGHIGQGLRTGAMTGLWKWLTKPLHATVLHGAAIWLWHVPAFFDAAVTDALLHRLQHVSFLATALLFWWAVWRRASAGLGVWHLAVTMLHTSILGAWMALAPRVLYTLQTVSSSDFGLSALDDQQLAGVIMWVPAGTVYAVAALVLAARWIGPSNADPRGAGLP